MANKAPLQGKTFLLGVGAQKAGTTWLHSYLRDHPQVCMSPVKEMHFFGWRGCGPHDWPITHFRKRLKRREAEDAASGRARDHKALRERIRMQGDVDRYRRFFRRRVKDAPVFGEITPAYCHLPAAEFDFINTLFADVRVIFLLRNPAERHWSQMRFSENADTVEDLEKLLPETFDKPVYSERNGYAATLSNLGQVFEPSQMHFDFYERLFTPEAVVRLCGFLGVDPHPAEFDRAYNVSVKMPLSPDLRRQTVQRLADQYRVADTLFGGDLPENWRRDMDMFL